MPQTSYSLDNVAALAGQAVSPVRVIARYRASEALAAGTMAELHTDGTLRQYRGGKKAGIVMYRDAKEPGTWQIDDYVPVLRAGSIWCQLSGSAGADFTRANFCYADTTTTDRGKATAAAASAASDGEIYSGGPAKFLGDTDVQPTGLALLYVDFEAEHTGSPTAATLISQVSNDFAIPAEHGGFYEINTTAANSTVSLPASAPDGTVVRMFADGTKNGHTLTFRDVTTTISAATTASKRVAAEAMKQAGHWAVTLTVAP